MALLKIIDGQARAAPGNRLANARQCAFAEAPNAGCAQVSYRNARNGDHQAENHILPEDIRLVFRDRIKELADEVIAQNQQGGLHQIDAQRRVQPALQAAGHVHHTPDNRPDRGFLCLHKSPLCLIYYQVI